MASAMTRLPGPELTPMPETPCPYCTQIMRWIGDGRRPGSGWFECERCGTFDVHGWIPPAARAAVCKSA